MLLSINAQYTVENIFNYKPKVYFLLKSYEFMFDPILSKNDPHSIQML